MGFKVHHRTFLRYLRLWCNSHSAQSADCSLVDNKAHKKGQVPNDIRLVPFKEKMYHNDLYGRNLCHHPRGRTPSLQSEFHRHGVPSPCGVRLAIQRHSHLVADTCFCKSGEQHFPHLCSTYRQWIHRYQFSYHPDT